MNSALVSQIQNRLVGYVQSRSTLRRFRDWFAPIVWDIEASEDPEAIDLAYLIDGILMESTSANWPETDLKRELADTIRPFEKIVMPRNILPDNAAVIQPSSYNPYAFTQFEEAHNAA